MAVQQMRTLSYSWTGASIGPVPERRPVYHSTKYSKLETGWSSRSSTWHFVKELRETRFQRWKSDNEDTSGHALHNKAVLTVWQRAGCSQQAVIWNAIFAVAPTSFSLNLRSALGPYSWYHWVFTCRRPRSHPSTHAPLAARDNDDGDYPNLRDVTAVRQRRRRDLRPTYRASTSWLPVPPLTARVADTGRKDGCFDVDTRTALS
ncbi:hypothetical protein Q8A73_006343 [Channa argus]|nr:hypothetical protein Q8A73_006343 [Channa argus]